MAIGHPHDRQRFQVSTLCLHWSQCQVLPPAISLQAACQLKHPLPSGPTSPPAKHDCNAAGSEWQQPSAVGSSGGPHQRGGSHPGQRSDGGGQGPLRPPPGHPGGGHPARPPAPCPAPLRPQRPGRGWADPLALGRFQRYSPCTRYHPRGPRVVEQLLGSPSSLQLQSPENRWAEPLALGRFQRYSSCTCYHPRGPKPPTCRHILIRQLLGNPSSLHLQSPEHRWADPLHCAKGATLHACLRLSAGQIISAGQEHSLCPTAIATPRTRMG